MASRASKTARAQARQSAGNLRSAVDELAEAARALVKKHGEKRSVTIVKGRTTSKGKPRKVGGG